jgi:hypothetical protein
VVGVAIAGADTARIRIRNMRALQSVVAVRQGAQLLASRPAVRQGPSFAHPFDQRATPAGRRRKTTVDDRRRLCFFPDKCWCSGAITEGGLNYEHNN